MLFVSVGASSAHLFSSLVCHARILAALAPCPGRRCAVASDGLALVRQWLESWRSGGWSPSATASLRLAVAGGLAQHREEAVCEWEEWIGI